MAGVTLRTIDYSVLQQCMHCGMCLPTCPTYDQTKQERNSPRGRIALMRAVADGVLEVSPEFAEEMSYCLGCLACQTACPAGVNYTELFETARSDIERQDAHHGVARKFWRGLTLGFLFMHPTALRLAGKALRRCNIIVSCDHLDIGDLPSGTIRRRVKCMNAITHSASGNGKHAA